jgi:micrococcal nuclease
MTPYTYKAIVVRVVDGDTVDVDIDLGFGVWFSNQRIRLLGVDTPECRTRDLTEKKFGLLAKSIVEGFCPVGKDILLQTELDDKGKFGRILGIILSDDVNVNEYLVENHYAVAYEGQSKDDIEAAHLANYQILTENGIV